MRVPTGPVLVPIVLASLALAGVGLVSPGCEGGGDPFVPCAFDPVLLEGLVLCAANEGGTAVQEDCVVTAHPQCPENICLSWAGSSPFCTMSCASDADCPADAACLPFGAGALADTEPAHYCVPKAVTACTDDASCP